MFGLDGHRLIRCFVSLLNFVLEHSANIIKYLHDTGRALDYRKVIDDFVAKTRDLRQHELTSEDWIAISMVSTWLKDFRSATTQMSATKHSMLSSTQAIFRGLQESLQESLRTLPDSAPSQLKQALINAHRKLSDYYTKFDTSPYYIWSSRKSRMLINDLNTETCQVLDPRISHEGLLADCNDDVMLQHHLETSKEELRQHYQDNYEKTASPPTVSPMSPSPSAQVRSSASLGSPQKVNFLARYKRQPQAFKDELVEFWKLPTEDFEICDPIQWWAGRRSQFPNLSRLARDILAIPGEFVFLSTHKQLAAAN